MSPQSPPSPWHVPEGEGKWRSELTKAGVSVVKRAALSELPVSQERRAVLASPPKIQAGMFKGGRRFKLFIYLFSRYRFSDCL